MTEPRQIAAPAALRKNYDVEAGLLDAAFSRKPASLVMTVVVAIVGSGLLLRHVPAVSLIAWLVAVLTATGRNHKGIVFCLAAV